MRYMFLALLTAFALAASHSVAGQTVCSGDAIFLAESCVGDTVSREEMELFDAVNRFREANGLAPVKLSLPLARLANRRTLDMGQNMKMLTHSWSNCPYNINDQSTWPCLIDSPRRLKCGYDGDGYETLFRTSKPKAEPNDAVEAWKKSQLHSSIILNKGTFAALPWEELGVAIDGQNAVLWFGFRPTNARTPSVNAGSGLGISFDRAVAGLDRLIVIERVSNVGDTIIWQGKTAEKRLTLEIRGVAAELESIEVAVSTATPGQADAASIAILTNLLKNFLPDLADREKWLAESLKTLEEMPKSWRRKTTSGRVAEIRGDGVQGFRLSIKRYVPAKLGESD